MTDHKSEARMCADVAESRSSSSEAGGEAWATLAVYHQLVLLTEAVEKLSTPQPKKRWWERKY